MNYLLNDREHVYFAGDMTVVGWVESGEEEYQDLLMAFMNQDESIHEQDIWDALERMVHGESFVWKEQKIDPDKEFYILGLSPNAARISVRFFLKNQFGSWLQNILQHESRMEIVLPSFIKNQKLPYWMMLNEMKAPGDKDNIPPLAAGMLRAILENSRYPDEMLYCTLRRCRADHDLNWKRMAMLKAYLLQNSLSEANKEGCKVALNEETNNQAYLLGRLFSILENTQEVAAGGNLNVTVKDHYFNSACSTPSLVFAQLLKLRESHMKKLYRDKPGAAVNLDKAFMDIMNRFDMEIPKQLNAEEQAVFMLGYYHQTQKKFEKKEGEQECQK